MLVCTTLVCSIAFSQVKYYHVYPHPACHGMAWTQNVIIHLTCSTDKTLNFLLSSSMNGQDLYNKCDPQSFSI